MIKEYKNNWFGTKDSDFYNEVNISMTICNLIKFNNRPHIRKQVQMDHEFNKICFSPVHGAFVHNLSCFAVYEKSLYFCITCQWSYRFTFHFALEFIIYMLMMFYRVLVLVIEFSLLLLCITDLFFSHSSSSYESKI